MGFYLLLCAAVYAVSQKARHLRFWHNFAQTSWLWIILGREDQEAITY